MTPKQISQQTGIALNKVYSILKQIREDKVKPSRNVQKVLKAQGLKIKITKENEV